MRYAVTNFVHRYLHRLGIWFLCECTVDIVFCLSHVARCFGVNPSQRVVFRVGGVRLRL